MLLSFIIFENIFIFFTIIAINKIFDLVLSFDFGFSFKFDSN